MRNADAIDAIVIGAGPVGLFGALLLQQAGMRVSLVGEETKFVALNADTWDSRVYAIAPDVLHAMQQLKVQVSRSFAYQQMQVWSDRQYTKALHFRAADYGWHALGEIIEHRELCLALQQRVSNAGIPWLREPMLDILRAEQSDRDPSAWRVMCAGQTLRSKTIIACDGQSSSTRQKAGIAIDEINDGAWALVGTIKTSLSNQSSARQHFVDQRVIAMLPLADDLVSMVYSADLARITQLQAQPAASMLAIIQAEFGNQLGNFLSIEGMRAVPLVRISAKRYVQDRVVLVGDAAHTVHPLAGLGLNMGMRDALCLARLVDGQVLSNQALTRYARERQSENQITKHALETLRNTFAASSGPLASLRAWGLGAVNQIAPLKRLFAELAVGKTAGWR